MTDYRKALDTLRGGQVRFVVIGGVAATLIRLKRAAGRPKDILALAELEALLADSAK